jgi:DNA-binding CsgD family transcriptional regulator
VGGERAPWITPREAEILSLIAQGLGDKEIAGRLGISSRTVGTHLERLFARLKVHSRAQALAWFYSYRGEKASNGPSTALSTARGRQPRS